MSLASMYDFKKVTDDKAGMLLASKFDRATGEVVEDLTSWIHRIAVKFNNPSKPMLAAKAYEEYMNSLSDFVLSEEAGEDQWTKKNGHVSDFSLSGNSNVANAFKRTLNAIKLGGDLVGSGSKFDYGDELDTVSKCMKFVSKRNAEVKKLGEQAQAIEELHQLIEEELGLARGTPEHDAEFQKRSLQLVADKPEGKPEGDKAPTDVYDEMGVTFAAALRELRSSGESESVVQDMAAAAIGRIRTTISKLVDRFKPAA